ncbi:hypothetical protein JB92DRAFT_3148826, partial [Gautieria morchelliformis]
MNDHPASQQPQQRDQRIPDFDFAEYIAHAVGDPQHHGLDIYGDFPQQRGHALALDTSMLTHTRVDHPPQNIISAEMLSLKGRLEQQMKLQQLQQLILQQQIELISGQPSINAQQKEAFFHGLLTPGPSAELPAVVPKDLVPPMMLQSADLFAHSPSATSIVNQLSPHPHVINPSFSAPAALAFPNSPPFPLPSPAQPGYDLSPLTSPWILPGSTPQQQQHGPPHPSVPTQTPAQQRPHLKRTISSSGDEQAGMRKRGAPHGGAGAGIAHARGTVSTSPSAASTPATRGAGSGAMPFCIPLNDTPSPVDLSMPPPAPPAAHPDQTTHATASAASSSTAHSGTASTSVSPDIAPMTPASILNLRKLTTGLGPATLNMAALEKKDAGPAAAAARKSTKNKAGARPGAGAGAGARGRRGSTAKPGFSPSLKPLLPGAVPPTPTSPLAHAAAQLAFPAAAGGTPHSGGGGGGPRKTSHKAAEQKRRDSLKTSFDELRLLLPPVPLLPEDGGDDPPLPGSMPPRGPPKGDADGPNRGVSKLALLRCGNGYIRDLRGKVERRDAEIERLRG